MEKQDAIKQATREALNGNIEMVVVDAPIENGEDESGPFGYCPALAKNILFRFGKVVAKISETGEIKEIS